MCHLSSELCPVVPVFFKDADDLTKIKLLIGAVGVVVMGHIRDTHRSGLFTAHVYFHSAY